MLYFSCAINNGSVDGGTPSCWEGDFVSTKNDKLLDFGSVNGGAVNEKNVITTDGATVDIYMHWSEADGAATSQYNLIEYSPTGAVVQTANDSVASSKMPVQGIFGVKAGDSIGVQLASGSPRFLHIEIEDQNSSFKVGTPGRERGHNCMDAVNSFTTAATPAAASGGSTPDGPYPNVFTANNQVEDFSCDGPRRMFFKPDGSPYTPGNFTSTGGKVFAKPDFTAADGVTTSVPAIGGDSPFYGTSCATPHAAALAALVLSYKPGLTPGQVSTILSQGAVAITKPGPGNRDAGAGILLASKIFAAIPNGKPVINSALNPPSRQGVAFGYNITATNSPTSYLAGTLPSGLTLNKTTGRISGTPNVFGTFAVGIGATNSNGSGTAKLTLVIKQAVPVITSSLTQSATHGQAYAYSITATNTPTSYGASGLPAGLTIDQSTGKISGTPTKTGTFTVLIAAFNSGGYGDARINLVVK